MNDDLDIIARENRWIFALCVGISIVMLIIWTAPKFLRWYDTHEKTPTRHIAQ